MSGKKESDQRILCVQGEVPMAPGLQPLHDDAQFFSVSNAAEAIAKAHDATFDLYLIAERLPDMAGADLCRELRRFDAQTPILLCVHGADIAGRPPAERLGIQGYLANTIDLLATSSAIRQTMSDARHRSIGAKAAAHAALVEALQARLKQGTPNVDLLIHEAGLMARTYEAFSRAGGTPADFKRMWPEIFEEARPGVRRR